MTRKTYRIEVYSDALSKWMVFGLFQYMPKGFADGAWSMLKSFYGRNRNYRLVADDGSIIDKWCSGEVHVN